MSFWAASLIGEGETDDGIIANADVKVCWIGKDKVVETSINVGVCCVDINVKVSWTDTNVEVSRTAPTAVFQSLCPLKY